MSSIERQTEIISSVDESESDNPSKIEKNNNFDYQNLGNFLLNLIINSNKLQKIIRNQYKTNDEFKNLNLKIIIHYLFNNQLEIFKAELIYFLLNKAKKRYIESNFIVPSLGEIEYDNVTLVIEGYYHYLLGATHDDKPLNLQYASYDEISEIFDLDNYLISNLLNQIKEWINT